MRSAYVKISLWSMGILICSCVLFLVISRANVCRSFTKDGDLGPRLVSQLAVAQRVYETDGKGALARHLQFLVSNYPGFRYYLASGNRDLVTGADLSALSARSNSRVEIFTLFDPIYVSTSSAGGRYVFLATVPSRMWDIRPYLLYYLVLLCAIAGLGWVLAFQFASPLNHLAEAVRCFGAGDLSARVRSARHDEIGELARAFDQMADRMQTLLMAERRLLQDVSHELRSPLARLSLAAELTRTSPDREIAAARVNKEIRRLTDLVEILLEVTRAEGDPGERNIDDVPLDALVREVVDDCGVEASARGCRLLLQGSRHFHLRADRELLRRAIENIVQNASGTRPPAPTSTSPSTVRLRTLPFPSATTAPACLPIRWLRFLSRSSASITPAIRRVAASALASPSRSAPSRSITERFGPKMPARGCASVSASPRNPPTERHLQEVIGRRRKLSVPPADVHRRFQVR